jgi:hypothetical protein
MNILFVISTDDAETAYNAMRSANVAVKKGDDVSVFMLGKGVLYFFSLPDLRDWMKRTKARFPKKRAIWLLPGPPRR